MKSAGSAPAESAAAPPAAPGGAPASATHETSRYVRALGVHKFRAEIPVASDVNLRLIEDFFVGLGYKPSSDLAYNLGLAVASRSAQHDQGYMRSSELTFTRRLQFIAASLRATVTVLPGSVSVTAECDLPRRTKHLADVVAIDATLRAELDDLAATLVSGHPTTERAVKAQLDLEQSMQRSRKEWIREQNSPMQIVLVVVGVVILLLLFSSGFWESLLGAFF